MVSTKKKQLRKNGARRNFGKSEDKALPLDLTLVQRESWDWFIREGISEAIAEISPVEDFTGRNWSLSFGEVEFGDPPINPRKASEKGLSYSVPLYVSATLTNKQTGKQSTQDVFLGDVPKMTKRGTFVINGIERAVVNQLVRSPGVYFSGEVDQVSGKMLYKAEIRPLHGSWLEFETVRSGVVAARIDRRRKVPATTLLRAISGFDNQKILEIFDSVDQGDKNQYIAKTLEKDPTETQEDAIIDIYKRMRPGEPIVAENAESFFENLFFVNRRYDLGKVGRYKLNKRLGLDIPNQPSTWVLQKEDVVATLKYLIGLQNGIGKTDDIDHLANRRVRRVGELVGTSAFRVGLLRLERSIKEKMSLVSTDENVTPASLVNARPIIASFNEFFRSNQLSAILDQTNPLAELEVLRRLSVLGTGGISRERASFSIRDINASQYSRIDPIKSPEGPNIGLVTFLSLYVRVNEYGFLEAPYRKVVKTGKNKMKVVDEVVWFAADDEEEHYITDATVEVDGEGFIKGDRVPLRFGNSFQEGSVEMVEFIDVSPRQVFGASTSLIPFLAHDEGNRALMGANMQCQAVPLVAPSSPVVGTGMEGEIGRAMGRIVEARHPGKVVSVDADRIEIKLDKKIDALGSDDEVEIIGTHEIYHLTKFKRTANSTCYNQKPRVGEGDRIKTGEVIADGPSIEGGELALGQNMVIAYCSFMGLGYEDAIVISDRLVKEDTLTSIHIEEYEASVVDTKLGPEELTGDIPNVSESELANLGADGIVVVGSEVGPNDILVGKIAPKGETELTSEERLLRAIFGEKAREIRDTSLRVPHGERGIVVDVSILDRSSGDELEPGTLKKVIVKVAQIRKVTVGDKLAGRHGNKGVISKIVPQADLPYLPDGTPVDIIISPLSVLSRMNLGQLLECHLGWALFQKGEKGALPVFDKIPEQTIEDELAAAGLPVSGKTRLFDGRTGEQFQEETVVGISYIMKLTHMVEDKTHARSTGPYSLVTQQPLGGKAQMGGQRLGEMEVWALEAHRAAHTLQEMLTIKSDDVVGRARAFEAIVKGTEIPASTVPESFKVLVRELNSLSLSIEPKGKIVASEEALEDTYSGDELAREMGAVQVAEGVLSAKSPLEVEEGQN